MDTEDNYEDYSSGRVLQGYARATNFPIRLAKEIFEKCLLYLKDQNNLLPHAVYDPLCGVAYTLTVLGMLYPDKIKSMYASDINQESLEFAEKNLSLLSAKGLEKRIEEIQSMVEKYGKISHKEALESALRIKEKSKSKISANVFKADALSMMPPISNIDIIITDLPYSNLTEWSENSPINPTQKLLDNIKSVLSKKSIIAISYNRKQEISYNGYVKVGTLKAPKRKVIFLKPQ